VLKRVRELVDRWNAILAEVSGELTTYDNLPGGTADAQRFAILQRAERLMRTVSTPLPPAPATLRTTVGQERDDFTAKRDAFAAILGSAGSSVAALLDAVDTELPITDFDPQPFGIDEVKDAVVTFVSDLAAAVRAIAEQAESRSKAAHDLLVEHDAATTAPARVAALDAAAKTLLGDDFRLVPRFGVDAVRAAEWQNAIAASTGGDLFHHLEHDLGVANPVDEWLYGVSPVREKMRAWQDVALNAHLFGRSEPQLAPIQLPHRTDDRWLALQFPSDYKLDGDRLLYTAHYEVPFAPGSRQCGLLVDEWTEVLPGTAHTAGVAFNFDRPGSEPPQTLLLVTPASWGAGAWQWGDLVGALGETLELAKLRAVEPTELDRTSYARFLPAVVMSAILHEISIGTVLVKNIGAFERIRELHA
jgi:hypothetical protein